MLHKIFTNHLISFRSVIKLMSAGVPTTKKMIWMKYTTQHKAKWKLIMVFKCNVFISDGRYNQEIKEDKSDLQNKQKWRTFYNYGGLYAKRGKFFKMQIMYGNHASSRSPRHIWTFKWK